MTVLTYFLVPHRGTSPVKEPELSVCGRAAPQYRSVARYESGLLRVRSRRAHTPRLGKPVTLATRKLFARYYGNTNDESKRETLWPVSQNQTRPSKRKCANFGSAKTRRNLAENKTKSEAQSKGDVGCGGKIRKDHQAANLQSVRTTNREHTPPRPSRRLQQAARSGLAVSELSPQLACGEARDKHDSYTAGGSGPRGGQIHLSGGGQRADGARELTTARVSGRAHTTFPSNSRNLGRVFGAASSLTSPAHSFV